MARQRFILQFVQNPAYYMAGTMAGGKKWFISNSKDHAKQFTYLQAVRYSEKYPGRFNIEPSLAGVLY